MMLQLFTNGLLTPKHEWVIAIETIQPGPEGSEPEILTHVIHSELNPLKAMKKDIDYIVENLCVQLKKEKIKVKQVHIVDLGPVGSQLNKVNRGLHRAKA